MSALPPIADMSEFSLNVRKIASVCRVVTRARPRPPFLPGHELHADTVIVDDQISVVVTPNCVGFDFLHFLSHRANIGCVIAALVAEAIEFKTVVEPRQRYDVLLESNVGTASATAATSAAMYATATVSATGTMSTTRTRARMTNAMPAATGTRMAATLARRAGALADVVSGFGCLAAAAEIKPTYACGDD